MPVSEADTVDDDMRIVLGSFIRVYDGYDVEFGRAHVTPAAQYIGNRPDGFIESLEGIRRDIVL